MGGGYPWLLHVPLLLANPRKPLEKKILGDVCLGLGVTMGYSASPEIPDFSTMSHLRLISTIPSMSALSGLQANLAVCSWEGQFISVLFLWVQEMLLSLLNRHKTLALLSTYHPWMPQ